MADIVVQDGMGRYDVDRREEQREGEGHGRQPHPRQTERQP